MVLPRDRNCRWTDLSAWPDVSLTIQQTVECLTSAELDIQYITDTFLPCVHKFVSTCMLIQCTTDACDCDENLPFDLTCDWDEK